MNQFVFSVIFICLSLSSVSVYTAKKCASNFLQKHLENMEAKQDTTVAPCDDFYTYACGSWDTTYHLRKLGARDTLTTVKAENKLLLIQYFDSIIDKEASDVGQNVSPTRKCLLDFYHSCVNPKFLDERNTSIKTYVDVLRRYSDWPILNPYFSESKANESFNWEYVSAQFRRYGASSFWRTLVQPNWQSAEQLIFYIVPPSFDFLQRSKRAYSSESTHKNGHGSNEDDEVFLYKTYVKYLLLDLGVRVRKALAYAEEIVEFEQKLLSLMTSDESSVVLKAPQTLNSLSAELPDINFQRFFDVLLQDVGLPENYSRKLLIVADNKYLRKLSSLLKKTGSETIGKYLLIQFLSHFEVNLHDDQAYDVRQEHCLQQANSFLPKELSRLFLDLQHNENGMDFLEIAQSDLSGMFDNLKLGFETLINNTSVFDHNLQTRANGLDKLYAMQLKLPDLKTGDECGSSQSNILTLENYDMSLLHLSKLKAFQELLGVNRSLMYEMESDSNNGQQNSPLHADNVHVLTNYGPLDVNAYYRLKKNTIEIPVGLLSLPIYDNCLDAQMIYGTIAFIVGHELLHGFDYDGLNYDKTGNIADGWDPKAIIAYGTKASCYLGTRYDNAHSNVNENIADSEGLRLALGALEKVAGPLRSDKLKLFFTSFAQIWCRAFSDYNERHTLHATHRERVNNVLGNFQSFAETFQCKSGSMMNPAEKCRIW